MRFCQVEKSNINKYEGQNHREPLQIQRPGPSLNPRTDRMKNGIEGRIYGKHNVAGITASMEQSLKQGCQ